MARVAIMISLVVLFCCCLNASANNIMYHHIYYYSIRPYIFKSNASRTGVSGMITEVLQNAMIYCIERKSKFKMKFLYYEIFKDHADYVDFIQSPFVKGEGRIKEVTPGSYLWMGPFLSLDVPDPVHNWVNSAFQMVESPGAYVVVGRYWVSWKWKMLEGVKNCENYLILSILMSVCMGTIVYLIESRRENEFGKSLTEGVWNGLWWSIVTMSTVGYGDIVPHSRTGRLISLLWLLFGVMMGSIITATVTNAIISNTHLNIANKKVSVLRYSWEKQIATSHGGNVIEKDTYEEIIESVRNEEVFAAVISSDIVQWRKEEIKSRPNPLAIVSFINIKIPVRMNTMLFGNISSIWNCLEQFRYEITNTPQRKYFKYVELDSIDYVSLREMLIDDQFGLGLLIATLFIVVISFTWFLLEKIVFKEKMSFRQAHQHFKDSKRKRDDRKTPPKVHIEMTGEPVTKQRHSRVSFGQHSNGMPHANGMINPYFHIDNDQMATSQFSERLEKVEKRLHEVKEALQTLTENKTERFDISGAIT